MKDFIFVNLEMQQTGAKPFDGMAAGTFIDMRGIKATFKPEDLSEYVANTKASILSTAGSDGIPVGLPIDPRGHYHDEDAAGWIVDVAMAESGDKIQFYPRWTALGQELIGNDLQRFFSPTIDLSNRVIMGGSLTNWPATRTAKGEILLKPLELSMSDDTLQLTDGSLDERVGKCKQSFWDLHYQLDAWPVEVFENHLICAYDGALWRVTYETDAEGNYSFAAITEWVKVKTSYIDAALGWVKRLFKHEKPAEQQAEITEGALDMPEAPAEMVSPPVVELTAEQIACINTEVELRVAATLAEKERGNQIAEFSRTVIGKGLPVEADALTAFLASLTPEQQTAAESILSRVADTGLVPLAELGHSQVLTGTKPLPDWAGPILKNWLAADLAIDEFFTVNAAELGNKSDYNLSEFTEVKNG